MYIYFITFVVSLLALLLFFGIYCLFESRQKAGCVFYEPSRFVSLQSFEKHFGEIRAEAVAARANLPLLDVSRSRSTWTKSGAQEFMERVQAAGAGWVRAWQLDSKQPNKRWLNFPLMVDGTEFRDNARHCPTLAALLRKHRSIINVAGFSLMVPHSSIPTHTDTTGVRYGSLAYHLGLVVPDAEKCTLTVDGKTVQQSEAKSIVFDSTYRHSARNDADKERIILYIDFKTG